jgi:hypothetical protein
LNVAKKGLRVKSLVQFIASSLANDALMDGVAFGSVPRGGATDS